MPATALDWTMLWQINLLCTPPMVQALKCMVLCICAFCLLGGNFMFVSYGQTCDICYWILTSFGVIGFQWIYLIANFGFCATFCARNPQHIVFHRILTNGSTVWSCPSAPLNLEWLLRSSIGWRRWGSINPPRVHGHPLFILCLCRRTWQPWENFHWMNLLTTPDRYPLPHFQDFTASLYGGTVFF